MRTRWVMAAVLGLGLWSTPASAACDKEAVIVAARNSDRVVLGIQAVEISDELRKFFGAPEGTGILISKVVKDTPARRAGIRVGDVLVKVDGDDIDDLGDVRVALRGAEGDKVKVVVIRRKKRLRKTANFKTDGGSPARGARGARAEAIERALEQTRRELREVERKIERLERKQSKGNPGSKKSKAKAKAKAKKRKRGGEVFDPFSSTSAPVPPMPPLPPTPPVLVVPPTPPAPPAPPRAPAEIRA